MISERDEELEDEELPNPEKLKSEADEALLLLEAYVHGGIQGIPPPLTSGPVFKKCVLSLNTLRRSLLVLFNLTKEYGGTSQSEENSKGGVDTGEKMSKTRNDDETQTSDNHARAGGPVPGNKATKKKVQG